MILKNFKISADGKFAVEDGTIKFTGAIVIIQEDTGTKEGRSTKALTTEDETKVPQEGVVEESSAKSVNLLEESVEEETDTDKDDGDEADADNDDVSDMPHMSTNATKESKILFHHDFDVDEDFELSQTISGFRL